MSPMIEFKNVYLTLKNQIHILENITYAINQGDFIILLGSNGSGKSSFLKLLDQRYQLTTGEICLPRKKIATLTQHYNESLFTSLTVIENYVLIKNKKEKKSAVIEYLNQFNENLKNKLHTVVDNLSGGEKQALALALNLINLPDILLLDEHTSALDPLTRKNLMLITDRMVKKYGITCILTTHDLDIATNYGNRILAIKNGKIHHACDNKNSLSTEKLLEACY